MDYILITGIIGSLIILTGAAWPESKTKNWFLLIGGLFMLLYAILNYQNGGPIFFVILEILVAVASILMMFNTPDFFDEVVISIAGLSLIIWSLYIFEGYTTIIFIFGLVGISLGETLKPKTIQRNLSFMLGSLLITIFSFMEPNWIFFWLNLFCTIFSSYYLYKVIKKSI